MLEAALAVATTEICNSDQGSHFTSPRSTKLLNAAGTRAWTKIRMRGVTPQPRSADLATSLIRSMGVSFDFLLARADAARGLLGSLRTPR